MGRPSGRASAAGDRRGPPAGARRRLGGGTARRGARRDSPRLRATQAGRQPMTELPEPVRPFWDAFQASIPYDAASRFCEAAGKPLPEIGALGVVTDWRGAPLCVIETTHVEIVPFDRVEE